ncbi:hypothetical protein [Zavarzinia aquatilis]|uniref:Uncharacterized protein n=1 Tax=Zavarzinia aquatilis TaxID=2211142 RepID=A0A317ED47_9PROT|nr:hypothetical protein [Zavarzinia aquatilis]PWR24957.1 hypothetical protein DKG74_04095 [Zavarzinia aquatilis]
MDALYVTCPRCGGERTIWVYTRLPTDFLPAVGETLNCPTCWGSGEVSREAAAHWRAMHADSGEASHAR